MPSFKKHAPFLLLLLLVYGAYFVTHLPTSKPQVLGATANLQLFTEPESNRTFLLQALDSAQKEILIEVYLLSDKQVISSLDNAENRGVSVKVMLEQHPVGSGSINTKTYHTLQQDGVPVAWTNPSFALTHEKAVIIDNKEVFVLSQNLSTSSFTKNREYDVEDTNAIDVAEARTIFIDDWQRQSVSLPAETDLLVSPVNARSSLEALLSSATTSITIEVEDIDDPQIMSLLIGKAKTMLVEIITPSLSQLGSNANALRQLKLGGVQVKTLSSPYIHGKCIVVDKQKAYVGSINLSTQSMDENRELGILVSQSDLVQQLATTFAQDWSTAQQFVN